MTGYRHTVQWLLLSVLWGSTTTSLHAEAPMLVNAGVEVIDDTGRHVHIANVPTRIVSLLPSLTESVCVLQACDRLVGTDRYSNWPASIRALPKLGGMDDVALEHLVALKPDLVLVARNNRIIPRLNELAIPVIALEATNLEDCHRVMALLAQVLQRSALGEQQWQQLEQRIQLASQHVPQRIRGRSVYFEISNAPFAASESSFIGEILTKLGMHNAVPGSLGPFPQLSIEWVVRRQPDVVMSGSLELRGMASRPGWSRLSAWQHGLTCGFSPAVMDLIERPGPRLGDGAEQIATCLNKLTSKPLL